MNVDVIIPALNEAGNIGDLVRQVKPQAFQVIVVDNNSTDNTAQIALDAGARVIQEPRRGYGYACAAGVAASTADVLVFLDGDNSFLPSEMPRLLEPILENHADLVLGSRALGHIESGAMPFQQRFGNALIAWLVRGLYHLPLSDLGPYRAVRRDLVVTLSMKELTYGWPAEMIIKAAKRHARIIEVPVSFYPRRAGQSKVSGTLHGTLLAGYRLLRVTFRYAWK
jgi:glycosyltransferase involved in cell wall biosynthesis